MLFEINSLHQNANIRSIITKEPTNMVILGTSSAIQDQAVYNHLKCFFHLLNSLCRLPHYSTLWPHPHTKWRQGSTQLKWWHRTPRTMKSHLRDLVSRVHTSPARVIRRTLAFSRPATSRTSGHPAFRSTIVVTAHRSDMRSLTNRIRLNGTMCKLLLKQVIAMNEYKTPGKCRIRSPATNHLASS